MAWLRSIIPVICLKCKWRRFYQQKCLSHNHFGPFCSWILKILVAGLIVFCCINVLFLIMIAFDKTSGDESGPNGLVHRKLEDLIYNKVNGQDDLFEGADKKVSRTRFLFVSYAVASPLLNHLVLEDQLFLVDVNQKIKEHDPDLGIYWGRVTRTNIVTALSLIRNVFDCDTDTESLLLTPEERDTCQQHVYRAVHVSHLSMRDLEPVLANYRTQVKVVILHQDPRTVYKAERVTEDARKFGARMCLQMMRDMERMTEFSTYARNSFTVFSEEVFLLFSEKMLADFLQFLEIESSTEIKLSKSRLQNLFIQHYAWKENSTSEVSIQRIDDKCQGLYELSIYKSLKQVNTFSFKGENYPLIFKLKI